MTGGQHDTSSCSTAASEQSERRKRPCPPSDDDAAFKPYECRFCPMKFGKSQALGGHMNRHRQEREREQVMNARQLLMQQEFSSSFMMSGQNTPSALPKLGQSHLQRLASDGVKDGNCMGSTPIEGAIGRNFMHSNPFNSSANLGPSSLSWNLGSASQSSIPSFNLDGMIPAYQARQTFSANLSSIPSSYTMPHPLNRATHVDLMVSAPSYEKTMQSSMYPFDPNISLLQRSSESLHGALQNQAQEGSILSSSPNEATSFISTTNTSFLHLQSHDLMKSEQQMRQTPLPLQSEPSNITAISNGFQFITFPGAAEEGARPSLLATNAPIDFNLSSSTNQLDGLPWLHKATPMFNALTTPNEDYQQENENAEPKMDDANLTGTSNEQPKTMKWDLALPSAIDNSDAERKVRDFAPIIGGTSTLSFEEADYSKSKGNLDSHLNR